MKKLILKRDVEKQRKVVLREREKLDKLYEKYDEQTFDLFFDQWIGRWFKFEIGGPDLISYGKIVGEEKKKEGEVRYLNVLEVGLMEEYPEWISLHLIPWNIGKFEHGKAQEIQGKELEELKRKIEFSINYNLDLMNMGKIGGKE